MPRVTVVNDNPEFPGIDALSILDELSGYEPTVLDGDTCSLDDIVATDPHVIFLDLRLGEGTLKGWDIALLLRAHDTMRKVPLIVCSADVRTLREREAEFLTVGNIHILEKPFSLVDVEALLEAALGATAA